MPITIPNAVAYRSGDSGTGTRVAVNSAAKPIVAATPMPAARSVTKPATAAGEFWASAMVTAERWSLTLGRMACTRVGDGVRALNAAVAQKSKPNIGDEMITQTPKGHTCLYRY